MTRDEFQQMLDQHGIVFVGDAAWRVAQIVAAAEREACVQEISEVRECIWDLHDEVIKETARNVCGNLIIRIRARGQA